MVWVKSKYAEELAVLSAWLSALLPWHLAYVPNIDRLPGSLLYVRFPFAQIQFAFGVPLAKAIDVTTPMGVFYDRPDSLVSGDIEIAYTVWYVGAAILAIAVLLGIAMYAREDRIAELLPMHPVRVMGGLITGASLVLAASTVLLYHHRVFDTYPLPIGLVVMLLLGASLLRVELLDEREPGAPEDAAGATASGE